MSKKFDKRKKVVYDLICDDLYTPMKFKELAMLLRVAKEDRAWKRWNRKERFIFPREENTAGDMQSV